MDMEKVPMAPTVSIEQTAIVRPVKVLALLCSVLGLLFDGLSIAASAWFISDERREGLWETCLFLSRGDNETIVCHKISSASDWLEACRVLCFLSMVTCFVALVITAIGLTTDRFSRKYQYYVGGMTLMIIAAMTEMISLIIYIVKSCNKLEQENIDMSWGIGWAYGLGWASSILLVFGSVLLYMDKNSDELLYREKTSYDGSIEEGDE